MRSQIASQAVFALGIIGLALLSPAGARADGDPIGKCCFEDNQGDMQCDNLTESACSAAGDPHLWEEDRICDQDGIGCPIAACIGAAGSCVVSHQTPGCNRPYCCNDVCTLHGPVGEFCCEVFWDATCVSLADMDCDLDPPNDECAPGAGPDEFGAITVPFPGSVATNNTRATTSASDPGFCCHGGVSNCIGGTNDGLPCVVAADCPSGSCPFSPSMPGALGYGSIWFKFIPPAGQTRALLHTCASNQPALDSVMQVFRATDHSSPESACASLVPIACNDDSPNCSVTERNSRICLQGLTPGETYYIAVVAKTPNRLGEYRVTISTNCTSGDYSCPSPCLDQTPGEPCCGNGILEPSAGEECEGTDDSNCPGRCQPGCRCPTPYCGDGVRDSSESCDGADDANCPGLCQVDCHCPGACCDHNGDDVGCRDNVAEDDCLPPGRVWVEGQCANIDCGECIPYCPGRVCGSDGCGGSCGSCEDGNACNGVRTCDEESGQCLNGTPVYCSDGNVCNGLEACDPATGECLPGTSPHCDDGLFCNGTEFCFETHGCFPGQPPCGQDEYCNEETDQCVDAPIPAVSAWGLATMALLFLIAAKIRVRHNAAS